MGEEDHREPTQMPEPAATTRHQTLDPTEVERLFREHHRTMLQAAWRVTGTLQDAEDVLQTVFLRLTDLGNRPDLSRSPAAYLQRAAINAALDVVRGRGSGRVVPLEDHAERVPGGPRDAADRDAHREELRRRLRAALARLSPKAAEIFALKHFEGRPNHEIARMLDMSNTAVGVTLHRARERLKELLSPADGGATP